MSGDTAKYWAFISYSHRDAKVAAALQRALETYRIPRRLVGTATALGELPAYLKPVFRDRDEMEAGADLKATVREALAQSRWLIVVCSPEAARSPWVNREIIEFKKLHGEGRVLAYIAAGEPFASRMSGREAEECFPEALRFALTPAGLPQGEALEPIAADQRPQGDGKRRAMLKLVAGMVGVGVDGLIHRDAQRRARRLAMVATASLAGMAVMAVLTVMAVQARIEAQSQRVQAEDLIEFMLGDLRKRLDAVGRLDVLDSVGEKALGYYARQEADRLDADALGRRSRAMHLIGEMREQRGKLDEALAAFQSAADTTEHLLARSPRDGQRIFDHAQSIYWVGYIAWKRGQALAAEEAFLQYRELAQQLVQVDPNNLDWQLETAFAHMNLGTVLLGTSRPADALKEYAAANESLSRLSGKRPELVLQLAHNYGWIAKAREALGDYDAAITAQRTKIELFRKMPAAEKNKQAEYGLQNGALELALLQLGKGDVKAAEQYARDAVQRADALVASDPENRFWQVSLYFADAVLAETEAALGNWDEVRRLVQRALDGADKLTAIDASLASVQVKLKGRALKLAGQLALAERRDERRGELEAYLARIKEFTAQKKVLDIEQNVIVAQAELVLGDLLAQERKQEDAATHWRAAAERASGYADQGNLPALTALAQARLRLGSTQQAQELARRIESTSYRHPAYADLVNELSKGTGTRLVQFK
ncbi:MAG: TIR domain-containing protein [Betaproteobacteria bacterium]|nr:TIR domain-containing protein [Betaproteobacteria bacterium]